MKTRGIRFVVMLAIVLFIIFGGVIVHRNVAAASTPIREKVYTAVKIRSGDTLWSIAETYCEDSSNAHLCMYVDDLKQINGICNEKGLIAGNYITVYYFR